MKPIVHMQFYIIQLAFYPFPLRHICDINEMALQLPFLLIATADNIDDLYHGYILFLVYIR